MGQGFWATITGGASGREILSEENGGDRRRSKMAENMRFVVLMPSSIEDARKAADALKSGSGVVINGEYFDSNGYQRVTDFLDGAAHVLGGSGHRVSEFVHVYVPSSIEIINETVSFYGNLTAGKKKRTDG